MEELVIKTKDGVELEAILLRHPKAEGVLIIHPATGVPFRYYSAFAKWYNEETRRHVLYYAYRDTEGMTPSGTRASATTMADWGITDQSAVLDFAVANFPDLEIHTIGHSLGGFCIPFHENADKITSHTGVNSGLAYWPRHPWNYLPQVILFWFLLGPLLTVILGYLPGILLGTRQNLPSGVYWQWRKWCTNERLHEIEWGKELPEPDLGKFKGSLRIIGTEDDAVIPWERVKILGRFYPNASSVERVLLKASDYNLRAIGHISIFSKGNSAVWSSITR